MATNKRITQKVAFGLFRLLSLSVVVILFAILGFIIVKGIGVIDWKFLTTAPEDGMTAGGIWPAIVGTFYLMVGSALFAFPVGVMSGIYMNEYAPKGWIVRFIRVMTNNLSGIPSIVFGLFGMALFVNYLGFGDSILAGSLTLGLLALPLVIRTTEEASTSSPGLSWPWAACRARRRPSSSPAPPTSCPSCRPASSTSAWLCPTTCTSSPPAARTSMRSCPSHTARLWY